MSKTKQLLKASFIALFMSAYLLKGFFNIAAAEVVMAVLTVLVFSVGLADLKPLNRNMIMLLLTSSGVFIWLSESFSWTNAITENAGIVTLLLTAPMLGVILHYAPYEDVLLSLANKYIKTDYVFYVMMMGIVLLLSPLMSLASLPFTHQLSKPIAAKHPAKVLQLALARAFVCNLYWAPNLVTVAVALKYTHLTWQELAPVGVIFSLLSFSLACIVGWYNLSSVPAGQQTLPNEAESAAAPAASGHMLGLLAIQLVCILIVLTVLSFYTKFSIYTNMALIAILIPLLFAILLGKLAVYRQQMGHYFFNTLPNMSNEFMLFITIGFFGYALSHSPVIVFVQSNLAVISGVSPSILVLLIIAAIAGLAIIGIHPIITISSLAITLAKLYIGLTSLQLAISLITGYSLYTLLSPFSTVVMIDSALFGENVYAMGIRMNWRYAVLLALVMTTAIHIWLQF